MIEITKIRSVDIESSPFYDQPKLASEPLKITDTQISLEKTKAPAKAETGFFTNILSWFSRLFLDPESARDEEEISISGPSLKPELERPDRVWSADMQKKLHETSEVIHNIKDINDEGHDYTKKLRNPYDLCDEIGLEKAWVKAQIDQIAIRCDQKVIEHEQLLKIHKTITQISEEIQKTWKERNIKAEKGVLFGNIEMGTSAFLIATSLVIGALAFSIGTGNIPGILLAINAGASIVKGGTSIYNATLEHEKNKISADLFEQKEARESEKDDLAKILRELKNLETGISESWKQVHEVENRRRQAVRFT